MSGLFDLLFLGFILYLVLRAGRRAAGGMRGAADRPRAPDDEEPWPGATAPRRREPLERAGVRPFEEPGAPSRTASGSRGFEESRAGPPERHPHRLEEILRAELARRLGVPTTVEARNMEEGGALAEGLPGEIRVREVGPGAAIGRAEVGRRTEIGRDAEVGRGAKTARAARAARLPARRRPGRSGTRTGRGGLARLDRLSGLRRAIVYAEILGPPPALRDAPPAPGAAPPGPTRGP